MKNMLYYGDNLPVLRQHIADESVDLIYLDPPFNSNATYNVLFAEKDGTESAAQIRAFEDTWHWDMAAAAAYNEVVEAGGQVSLAMQGFRTVLGNNDMLAYLSMMAPRLVELHRVLKPTGSMCLHCDPTASHDLKMLLDAIFGPERFISEIVWKRTHSHGDPRRKYGAITDTLFPSRNRSNTHSSRSFGSSRPTTSRERSPVPIRMAENGNRLHCVALIHDRTLPIPTRQATASPTSHTQTAGPVTWNECGNMIEKTVYIFPPRLPGIATENVS